MTVSARRHLPKPFLGIELDQQREPATHPVNHSGQLQRALLKQSFPDFLARSLS
jgi:hypothetical protein